MSLLVALYRRWNVAQQGRRFRMVAAIIAAILWAALFIPLLMQSANLGAQRAALVSALAGQSVENRDEHAVSLQQQGTVTVNGRTYGGEIFQRNADLLFTPRGTIAQPETLAERLLADQYPAWAPRWTLERLSTTAALAIITLGWLLLVVWMGLLLQLLLTLAGTLAPVGVCWVLGADQAMLAIAGIGVLTFSCVLFTRVLLVLINRPIQPLAVAHTVIKEASRSRISLSFIVTLLVLLPLLPFWLDEAQPLRYQLQTFISRSMGLTFAAAACMTLFLATSSVAFEIRDRQIWQLMTKPVSRVNYLVGKWLGVMLVNVVLLTVSGVSTMTFIQYLRTRPVAAGLRGEMDAIAVRDEVLTAREARIPDYRRFTREQLSSRVEQVINSTPELAGLGEDIPLARIRRIEHDLQEAFNVGQRTIPPQSEREYVFTGLKAPREIGGTVTLRYRFHILRSDEHETFKAYFMINRDPNTVIERTYVPTMSHPLQIPTEFINDQGQLLVSVFNGFVPVQGKPAVYGSINFEIEDFELMYKVGDFEPNFIRANMVNLIKLSFLAMLGITAATFLSFPVACLLSFTVFVGGMVGPYLAVSLGQWAPSSAANMDWSNLGLVIKWVFDWSIKLIAESLVSTLGGFGEISATRRLVEGRLVSWGEVVWGFMILGVVWSGIAMVTGLLVIRSRQLAIYSGQG